MQNSPVEDAPKKKEIPVQTIYGQRMDDLPIVTAQDCMGGFMTGFYLLETKEFIKLVNHFADQQKQPSWKVTLRTLQFYSSPQLRIMPRPILRGGHKGHYMAPDHVQLFFTIQKLKQKYFLPLWLIREILVESPPGIWQVLGQFGLPTDEFLEMLPYSKKIKLQHLLHYQTCKSLAGRNFLRSSHPMSREAFDIFQHDVHAALQSLEKWIDSEDGRQTFEQVEHAKEDPEVQRLAGKIGDYKKKLLRQA